MDDKLTPEMLREFWENEGGMWGGRKHPYPDPQEYLKPFKEGKGVIGKVVEIYSCKK